MSPTDAFAATATQANGVAMDPARLTRHAALVAEMNGIIAGAAASRLDLGAAPWSLQTLKLQEAARTAHKEDQA